MVEKLTQPFLWRPPGFHLLGRLGMREQGSMVRDEGGARIVGTPQTVP